MMLAKTSFYYNRHDINASIDVYTAHVPAIQISYATTRDSSYVGQNSFGATARVSSSTNHVNYIAAVELPRGDVPEMARGLRVEDPELDSYEWERELDGPQAKAIYQGSKMVMEGVIASFPDGKVTKCDASAGSATISEPSEYLNYECYVAAKVSRIAFIAGDGTVLREWKSN